VAAAAATAADSRIADQRRTWPTTRISICRTGSVVMRNS